MKSLFTTLTVFFISFLNIYSFTGEGAGTEDNPYQITDVNQLQEMQDDLTAHYIIMNDIDASDTKNWNVEDHDNNSETADVPMGFGPIGSDYSWFSGTFDGNHHTISGLYILHDATPTGLFAYLTEQGSIMNVSLTDCSIEGSFSDIGVLVGRNSGMVVNSSVSGELVGIKRCGLLVGSNIGGIINYCSSSGKATATDQCGGLVGYMSGGEIAYSYSVAEVSGDNYIGGLLGDIASGNGTCTILSSNSESKVSGRVAVGGLIGRLEAGNVNACYSNSEVSGDAYVGGLIGLQWGDKVEYSNALGNISGLVYTGGLVGESRGTISFSYSECIVEGTNMVGGLVGQNYGGNIQESYSAGNVSGSLYIGGLIGYNINGTIENAYSLAQASGVDTVGGLIGRNDDEVLHCYSAGMVSGDNIIGGLIGFNDDGSVQECFWDIETSTCSISAGGTGLSTSQMKIIQTYTDSLWDFNTIWAISSIINDGYPYLQWEYSETDVNESLSKNNLQLKIFPNPATDNINIILPKEEQRNFIRISDVSGREVKNVSINSYTDKISMNISDLPQGFYIINLYSGGEVYSSAILVE